MQQLLTGQTEAKYHKGNWELPFSLPVNLCL